MNTSQILRAVHGYERLSGLRVCFHDHAGGSVRSVFGMGRQHHFGDFCTLVKKHRLHSCTVCDMGMVRSRLNETSVPFVKMCHAGAGELVWPVTVNGRRGGVLFAGQFIIDGNPENLDGVLLQRPHRVRRSSGALSTARHKLTCLPVARIKDLLAVGELLSSALGDMSTSTIATKGDYRQRILGFLQARSGMRVRLHDLAEHLHLSESRAGRLVHIHFGMTFPALLTKHRIGLARHFLEDSHLPVVDIARQVGMSDVAYFHRVFRKNVGTTPLAYRRAHHQNSVERLDV